jgi:pyruvate ferredoxin oxidoreductase beta subunit
VKGPAVLVVMSTCPTLWGSMPNDTIKIAKLAVDSCIWPLYEIENGKYRLNYRPSSKIPAVEFVKTQRRFKHLFMPGNEYMLENIQKHVDSEWENLLELCGEKK